jgi:hypothetical protein
MQAVSSEEFVRCAADHNIGVDPRYPDSRCLTLLPPTDHARLWVVPADPATWPHFVASPLGGLAEWTTGLQWRRSGTWPKSGRPQHTTRSSGMSFSGARAFRTLGRCHLVRAE